MVTYFQISKSTRIIFWELSRTINEVFPSIKEKYIGGCGGGIFQKLETQIQLTLIEGPIHPPNCYN